MQRTTAKCELTTCGAVAVNGNPRMRMIICPPRERKACASVLLPANVKIKI